MKIVLRDCGLYCQNKVNRPALASLNCTGGSGVHWGAVGYNVQLVRSVTESSHRSGWRVKCSAQKHFDSGGLQRKDELSSQHITLT